MKKEEFLDLRSQIVTSKSGGTRYTDGFYGTWCINVVKYIEK